MINKAIFPVALAMAAWSAPAAACQWPYEPEPIGWPTADYFSKGIVAAASTVDLVIAERSRTVPLSPMGAHPQATTFRVLQRMKGGSPDRFTLFTTAPAPGSEQLQPRHMVSDDGRVRAFPWPTEAPPGDVVVTNSCSPGFISASPGQLYIVARDGTGRLLKAAASPPGGGESVFSFVPATLPRFDPWYDGLFLASAVERERPGPRAEQPPALPSDAVATLRFDRPQSAAAVAALLKRIGATPFAVHVAAGDFIDETRMPREQASAALPGDAVAQARANLAASADLGATAREALKRYDPYHFDNDGWVVLWAQALLAAEDRLRQARAAGVQGIVSVEVSGNAAAWGNARREPTVAEVLAGAVVQGREVAPLIASKAVAPTSWEAAKGKELVARLRTLAGR